MKKNFKKSVRGFVSTEFMLVFALVMALGAGAAYGVLRAWPQWNASKLNEALQMSVNSIQNHYRSTSNLTKLTTAAVAQNELIDSKYIVYTNNKPAGTLTTPFGALTYAAATGGQNGEITLAGMTSRDCKNIAAAAIPSESYTTATIGGTTIKAPNTEMDPTTIGTACDSSGSVTMKLTFQRA